MSRNLVKILSLLFTAAGIYFFVFHIISSRVTIKVCNTAPYATNHIIVARSSDGLEAVGAEFQLGAGDCTERSHRFWRMEPELLVQSSVPEDQRHALQYVNNILNEYLLNDEDRKNDENAVALDGSEVETFGTLFICGPPGEAIDWSGIVPREQCEDNQYRAGFLSAFRPDDGQRWAFVYENPNLSMIPDQSDFWSDLEIALSRAKALRRSVNSQITYIEKWQGVSPFTVGGRLVDFNGPLAAGVGMDEVLPLTIFREEMPLQNGDVILELNGVTVHGADDLMLELIAHGMARDKGIEVPVSYVVQRGKDRISVETTYYFNQSYRTQGYNKTNLALWYGIGDMATFGNSPWTKCHGINALKGLSNGAKALSEWLKSKSEDRTYNPNNIVENEYIDADECIWQAKQTRAMARQQADKVYINSQWLGIFTPSAFRLVGVRAIKAAQIARTGALSGRVAAVGLEAAETALWSFSTATPGTPLEQRFKTAIFAAAPMGAAGGFVTGAAIGYKNRVPPSVRP